VVVLVVNSCQPSIFFEQIPSNFGRGDRIRTSDPLRPRQVRYQAALRPDPRRFSVSHRNKERRNCHGPLSRSNHLSAMMLARATSVCPHRRPRVALGRHGLAARRIRALSIGPLRVSSSDSVRPLSVALVATVIYVALAGSAAVREDARRLLRALTPRRLALLLTARITDGSVAAGQPQRANQDRERPLGYAAVADETAIAPITPPGLPLLMAAFKWIGGPMPPHFSWVPLTGGLLGGPRS
jgi:hypothetical protein